MAADKKKPNKEKPCRKCFGRGCFVSVWSGHKVPCDCAAGKEYEDVGDFEDDADGQPRDYGDL